MSNKEKLLKSKTVSDLRKPKYNVSNSLIFLRSSSINIDQPDTLNLTDNLPKITKCEKLLNTSKIYKNKPKKKIPEDKPDSFCQLNELKEKVPHLKHSNSVHVFYDRPDFLCPDKADSIPPKFLPKLSFCSAISRDKFKKNKSLKRIVNSVNLEAKKKLILNDSKKVNNEHKTSINSVSFNKNSKVVNDNIIHNKNNDVYKNDEEEFKKNKYRTDIIALKKKELEKGNEIEKLKNLEKLKEAEHQKEMQRLKDIEKQKDDEHQKEIEKLKEIERQKELEHQKEIELQKEKQKQKELEHQKEIESQKKLEEEKEIERQKEIEKQKELEEQIEIEHQKEIEKQKELEQQRELERKKEIEKQNEYEKKLELKRKKELEKLKEIEKQKELERQKELQSIKEKNQQKEIKYKSKLEILQQLEKHKQLIHKNELEKLKEIEQKNDLEIQKKIENHKLEIKKVEKEIEILKEQKKEEEKELETQEEKQKENQKGQSKNLTDYNRSKNKSIIQMKNDETFPLQEIYNKKLANKLKYELQKDLLSKEMLKEKKVIGKKYFFSKSIKEIPQYPRTCKDISKRNIFQDYKNSCNGLKNNDSLISKIKGVLKKNSKSLKSIDDLLKNGINEQNLKKLEDKYQNNYELIKVIKKYKNKKFVLENYDRLNTPKDDNDSNYESSKSNKSLRTYSKKMHKINLIKTPFSKLTKINKNKSVIYHSGSAKILQFKDYCDLSPFYYLNKGIKFVKNKRQKYNSLSTSPCAKDNDVLINIKSNNNSHIKQLSEEEIIKSKVNIYKDQVFKLFMQKLENEKNNEGRRNVILNEIKDDFIKDKIEKKFAYDRAKINMKLNKEYEKLNVIVNGFERNLRSDCLKKHFSQSFDNFY